MYICICNKITDRYLDKMIQESKITTVENFCKNTNFGKTCCKCIPILESKLKENNKLYK